MRIMYRGARCLVTTRLVVNAVSIRLWMCVSVLTWGATPAYAQERVGVTGEVSRALSALQPLKVVRLHTPADGRIEGHLVSVDGDSVVLLNAGKRRVLSTPELDSVWTRRGHAGHGALIGGAVGLGLGLLSGFAIKDLCGSSDPCISAPPVLGGGGLVAGGLVGLGVGLMIHSYSLQAPRDKEGTIPAAATQHK